MSDQHDNPQIAQLKRVNAELSHSLERCRHLVSECRAKLAANSNEPVELQNTPGSETDSA